VARTARLRESVVPNAVHQLTATLYAVADAVDAGVPRRAGELPDDEALKPVTDAVRPSAGTRASPNHQSLRCRLTKASARLTTDLFTERTVVSRLSYPARTEDAMQR
jgi:hypothetical protein